MEPGGALAAKVPPTGGETTVGQVARWQDSKTGRRAIGIWEFPRRGMFIEIRNIGNSRS